MCGRPHRGSIDAGTTAVVCDRSDYHVEILLPVVDAVFADDDLAVAGAVYLNARIVFPHAGGGRIAEQQRTTAASQNLSGAGMVGRVKTESFARRSGFN